MHSKIKRLSIFAFLVFIQISCAQRKPQLYTVAGTVTATYAYCGGARPSAEMLAELNRPKPMANKKLFIKSGAINTANETVIKSFETDANGYFKIELAKGSYCVVDEIKSGAFKLPATDSLHKWDANCLKKEYERCDYQLNVSTKTMDSVKVTFFIPCQWDSPCLDYSGPLPPSMQRY